MKNDLLFTGLNYGKDKLLHLHVRPQFDKGRI